MLGTTTLRVLALLVPLALTSYPAVGQAHTKKDLLRQTKLPSCRACRLFVDSFKRGMKKTETGKFEGGDAAWEEEKLQTYAKSEIRFIEIQEQLCSEIEEGRDQCYSLSEEHDALLEEWWFNKQDSEPDLYTHFCIEEAKYCCPEKHYGTNCTPCPGYPDNICSNNGKCKGEGTRKGNGQCLCVKGYGGEDCDRCASNYFQSYKDDNMFLCNECHVSCDGECSKAGPAGCEKCASGWIRDETKGCLDVNECAAPKSPCSPLQFCVNTDGAHKCLDCDRACAGCTGDGPDMCKRCASGFKMKDKICIDSEQEDRDQYVNFTRYCTYFGLCVATCIIFQRSVGLAALIGLAVAVYISLSEYILHTTLRPNSTNLAEQVMQATQNIQ